MNSEMVAVMRADLEVLLDRTVHFVEGSKTRAGEMPLSIICHRLRIALMGTPQVPLRD